MSLLSKIFGTKKVEEEKILNDSVMAKKQTKIVESVQDLFINDKKVKVSIVREPHYAIEITTFKNISTTEKVLEQREVEEEVQILSLEQKENETKADYDKRKAVFDRVMMVRSRGGSAELPEDFKTINKAAKVKTMGTVEIDKTVTEEKEDKTETVPIYFRPQSQQIIEFLRNYLNAQI